MPRPDYERLQQNMAVLYDGGGEEFQLRQFVSASGAANRFGYENQMQYITRTVTGLFKRYSPAEIQRMGGQFQGADLFVTTDFQLSARDELIWNGSAYRIAGNADHQTLGGHVSFHSPLTLASKTG